MDSSNYARKYMKYKLKYKNLQKSIVQAGGNKYKYRLKNGDVFFVFSDHEEVPLNAAQKEALYKFTEKFEPDNWTIIADVVNKPPEYVIDIESNFDMGSVFIAENPVSKFVDVIPVVEDIRVIYIYKEIQKLGNLIEQNRLELEKHFANSKDKPDMYIFIISEIRGLISAIKQSIKNLSPYQLASMQKNILIQRFQDYIKWVDDILPSRDTYVFRKKWEPKSPVVEIVDEKPPVDEDENPPVDENKIRNVGIGFNEFLKLRMKGEKQATLKPKKQATLKPLVLSGAATPSASRPVAQSAPFIPSVIRARQQAAQSVAPSVSQPVMPLAAPSYSRASLAAPSVSQSVAPPIKRIPRPPPYPPSEEQRKRQTEQQELALALARTRAQAKVQPAEQASAAPSAAQP